MEGGDKDYAPDGGKYDPSLHPRRKNKCIPKTLLDPPRGVLRANSRAPLHLLASPLAAGLLSVAALIL